MSISSPSTSTRSNIAAGAWQLDPMHSSIEFHVRHFYGLMTVAGRFARYYGRLELSGAPAVSLVIDADSLDTGNARRDTHLRSADFFGVASHPEVRFQADRANLAGDALTVPGTLSTAGRAAPLTVEATITEIDGELSIDARGQVDHRELGMTWSPLGILRSPSQLIVRGRLLRVEPTR